MKTITVNEKNIKFLSPYQGQNKVLNIGEMLYEVKSKIPCVTALKGQSKTFSIVTDKKLSSNTIKHLKEDQTFAPAENSGFYNCNRWSLNSKFL